MTRSLARPLAAAFALALVSGCKPPKYAPYVSVSGDFKASVPWGWEILAEAQDTSYAEARFIGPFDPDFFLGAPSLSVRWYRNNHARRLRDGRLELFKSPDDFYKQMLREVYAPRGVVSGIKLKDGPDGPEYESKPSQITLKSAGLEATFFTVLSPMEVSADKQWGVSVSSVTKRAAVLRKHSYVLVPVEGGFYVLCYPATQDGYDKLRHYFEGLVGSFTPLTAGPGGPKIILRAPARP